MKKTRSALNEKENTLRSILEAHKGIIYKVANSYCSDTSDRDDLIQEIALQVWLSLDRFDDKYKQSTWIYRIALNTSISFYRKHRTRKEKMVRLSPVIEVPAAEESSFEDEQYLLLRKLIRDLREIDRALILLHLEGLSTHEIAEIIETTPTNVTTKISRIRKKLRRKFEDHKNKNHG